MWIYKLRLFTRRYWYNTYSACDSHAMRLTNIPVSRWKTLCYIFYMACHFLPCSGVQRFTVLFTCVPHRRSLGLMMPSLLMYTLEQIGWEEWESRFSVFWVAISGKWTKLKNFFGLCFPILNYTRKTLFLYFLRIAPQKVPFTPTSTWIWMESKWS